jgi:tetratricopeptide (TPR) repeat protein
VRLAPDVSSVRLALLQALDANGETQEALTVLEQLRSAGEDHYEVLLLHARAMERASRWQAACEDWDALLARQPEWGCGWWRRGCALLGLGRPGDAEASLRRALDADGQDRYVEEPRLPGHRYRLPRLDRVGARADHAAALMQMGRFREAVDEWAACREAEPANRWFVSHARDEALVLAVGEEFSDEEASRALPLAMEAARRAPTDPDAQLALCAAHVRLQAWPEAARALAALEEASAGSTPLALLLRAHIEWATNRQEESVRAYEAATDSASRNSLEHRPVYRSLLNRTRAALGR